MCSSQGARFGDRGGRGDMRVNDFGSVLMGQFAGDLNGPAEEDEEEDGDDGVEDIEGEEDEDVIF